MTPWNKGKKFPETRVILFKACLQCLQPYQKSRSFSLTRWKRSKFCSMKCSGIHATKTGSKRGANNATWKGDRVGYGGLHDWIRKEAGTPSFCEHCHTTEPKRFEWANKSGLYRRERSDWIRLCKKCHNQYDDIPTKIWVTRKAQEHHVA
jgi:hypothetical protein